MEENKTLIENTKQFFNGKFQSILKTIIFKPLDGCLDLFKNVTSQSYSSSLILYLAVFLIYFIGNIILAGEQREFMTLMNFISFALIPILIMLCISLFSFLIKSFFGPSDIKNELFTGAIAGIPIGFVIPAFMLLKIVGIDAMSFLSNPFQTGILVGLLILYLIYFLINIVSQSLKASAVKDLVIFYSAPLVILLSIFLAMKLIQGF